MTSRPSAPNSQSQPCVTPPPPPGLQSPQGVPSPPLTSPFSAQGSSNRAPVAAPPAAATPLCVALQRPPMPPKASSPTPSAAAHVRPMADPP
eukprot:CAMPEP_0202339130 /NCGR_PEP_ID=MMETSP1126-20121109/1130_1 /ASSEMBLY_ACC=CAM_ASM_000457 /TAXON_ID=3047 /ORGANISM="Dunaliella tertiolecta, Strain CCMP1320" /LENGTH=91 /DNA_ID=CAMNT_0048929649 /DNA_START=159 /DNA_END=431 /DNA_ORIENTATION=+